MKPEFLFEQESIISQSTDKTITLTNKRIQYHKTGLGKSHFVSIHLEKISSIEIHYRSWILVLIFGLLLAASGLYFSSEQHSEEMAAIGAGGGLICVFIYFVTRKHMVTISSDAGTSIGFQTKGMKKDVLMDFINKIEKAKNNLAK